MEIINVSDEIIEVNVTEEVVNIVTQTGAYPLPSNVFSVFGRTGNVVGQAGDYTTSLVGEGTNLYYTNARSRAAISEDITGINYDSASGIFTMASGYVIPTQAMLDAKVPYTGATGNVTLGEHQLSAGQVTFDQTPTGSAGVGVLRWNDTDGTLDLGLKGGNVTLQVGQEMVARVVNKTGADLLESNYQVVRISSAQGQRLAVQLAQANNDANSTDTIGIVTETITNNQEGFITILGQVKEINTTGSLQGETWADGDVLYLSPTTAGKITNIKPTAPQHMVVVGYVEYAHSQHGKIYAKVANGYELEELHDVAPTPYINKGLLYRDTTTNLWKSATIDTLLGYTPVTSARSINTTAPLTGGGDLSADRTLSMPAATTSANGYLTSTDWNTFNNKQPLITAGTTAQYYRGDKTFQTLDTLAVPENTNLYYTDARARAAITGTAPISVTSGVVSISQAGGASNGYLSSTDWNTFNNKQAALNGTGFVKISGTTISYDNNTYLTTISGIAAGGELSGTYANPSLVNSAVTGKVLTGLNLTGGGTISDTDSILGAFGKVQNQISALVGGVMYEGTWNASTNTPTITSSVGSKGDYYIVATAGSTNINGITSWNVGDWIIFNGSTWDKVDNTDAVSSVNGYTGAVSLVTSDVPESGSLYFTNARAIGSTLTGYTSGSGVVAATDTILQAIQKLNGNVSGLVTGVSSVFGRTGAVVAASGDYTTTQVTEGTNLYYTEARVNANTNVAANTAARHNAVTIGTANGLSLSTQVLSLAAASNSTTGALTSTDWNTFNGKQDALTNPVTGTGTTNYLPKFTGSTTIGNSNIQDNGTIITLGSLVNYTYSDNNYAGLNIRNTNTGTAALSGLSIQNSSGTSVGQVNYVSSVYANTTLRNTLLINTIFDNKLAFATNTSGGGTRADIYFSVNPAFALDASNPNQIHILGTSRNVAINYSGTDYGQNFQVNGTTRLSDALTGTSATFSSTLSLVNASTSVGLNLNRGSATLSNAIVWATSNTSDWFLGSSPLGTSTSDLSLYSYGTSSVVLNIARSTGAATFSSSVTAGGGITTTGNLVNIRGGDTYLWFTESGVADKFLIGSSAGNNDLVFRSGAYNMSTGSERMRITTSGNVGIGTSSPASKLHINNDTQGGSTRLTITNPSDVIFSSAGIELVTHNGTSASVGTGLFSTSNNFTYGTISPNQTNLYGIRGGGIRLATGVAPIIFANGNADIDFASERMRITSGGNVLIGTNTANANTAGLQVNSTSGTNIVTVNSSSVAIAMRFFTSVSTQAGYIILDGSTTSYVTSSDYRLKHNLKDYNGIDLISKIKTYDYEWKADNTQSYGVLAHELQEIIPQAVFGEKDGEDMQGVDYSKLVPILVKSIQELEARIKQLENK